MKRFKHYFGMNEKLIVQTITGKCRVHHLRNGLQFHVSKKLLTCHANHIQAQSTLAHTLDVAPTLREEKKVLFTLAVQ